MPTVLKPPTLKLNLTFKQGADATIDLTVTGAGGTPITNTAGYSVLAQIRKRPSGIVLFEWDTTPGGADGTAAFTYTPGPPPESKVTLAVTATQSALFTWIGIAHWDCFLTNPAGQKTCLAEGRVTIDQRITRP